jgi:hypothetical protein
MFPQVQRHAEWNIPVSLMNIKSAMACAPETWKQRPSPPVNLHPVVLTVGEGGSAVAASGNLREPVVWARPDAMMSWPAPSGSILQPDARILGVSISASSRTH